ncbi:DegQ family serine endoprotease [bacterium]|jgi:serine protease Do|nr:DegQ family serine endoprotease [bacterium]MBT6776653.1 DegQ family serine endoprotease [bacterium]
MMLRTIIFTTAIIANLFSQNSVVQQFSDAFADVAENAKPAVVTIITDKIMKVPNNDLYFFFNPYMDPNSDKEYKTNALGSGVIVDARKGYILTNNHVVEDMDNIKVKLFDKREYKAKIMGTDPKSDLAILKIEADNLRELQLGNSDKLRVGEWVMAVGSPFSENLSHTVTTGIVSAMGRSNIIRGQSYEDFIQTDAAINPGNSGGALLNMKGELIGINTAIATGGYEKGNRGVGFAIPSNMSKRIMSDLIDKGYVTRSWLGVYIQPLDADAAKALEMESRDGALITQVVDDSPAELAGIEEGDVIVKFDNKKISDPSNLRNIVSLMPPGSKSDIVIFRNGNKKNLNVTLQELKDGKQVAVKTSSNTSVLGLELKEINSALIQKYNLKEDDGKIIVVAVEPGSEAADKGLVEGDVIKRVGTQQVRSLKEFKKKEKASRARGSLLLLVKKNDGSSLFITLNY